MQRWLVLVAVCMAQVSIGVAAETVEVPIGPGDAARIALEQHPTLEVAQEDVRIAQADHKSAGGGYLPRIDLTEDWVRSNNPVFVFSSKLLQGVFTSQDFELDALNHPDPITNSKTSVSIYQNIWNGRAIPQRKAAAAGIAAAESAREATRDAVVFGSLRAFWSLVQAREMARVAADAERAAEANLALATERYEAGLTVSSDRMAAEVRLADVTAMRIRADAEVEVAHAALARALGEKSPEVRYVPMPIEGRPPADEDSLEGRLDAAWKGRADLEVLDRRIDQARVGSKVARAGYYPDVGAFGDYQWNGERLLGADGENWTVGLAVRFTVFDGNRTQGQSQRARAEAAKLEAMRAELAQGIRLEVTSAWTERESARLRLDVADAALDRAREALRIVRERYAEGMAVIVELLTAETALTEAEARRVRAMSELWLADAGLDLASGVDPLPDQPSYPAPGRS